MYPDTSFAALLSYGAEQTQRTTLALTMHREQILASDGAIGNASSRDYYSERQCQ